jgi:hypothetical protein
MVPRPSERGSAASVQTDLHISNDWNTSASSEFSH